MCVTSTDLALLQGQGSELSLIEHPKSGRELVPPDAARSSVALRESLQAERRADQQRHHHRQIWTKDPHDGPYKKVISSSCELLNSLKCLAGAWDELNGKLVRLSST